MSIEQVAFSAPWPASAYRYELTQNDLSTYLVLKMRQPLPVSKWPEWLRRRRSRPQPPILAYGGLWLMVEEVHISTIATHPGWRGHGLGEMMLVGLIEAAILRQATVATLEVRVSNTVAQNLYLKCGFTVVGKRKKYYHDNNEDALIMTTPRLDDESFLSRYTELKSKLKSRLPGETIRA